MAETVIRTYPRQFNAYRDMAKTYDVAEGYAILRQARIVNAEYQMYEELVSPYHAFTKKGRQALINGVSKLSQGKGPLEIAIPVVGTSFLSVVILSSCFWLIPIQSGLTLEETVMEY